VLIGLSAGFSGGGLSGLAVLAKEHGGVDQEMQIVAAAGRIDISVARMGQVLVVRDHDPFALADGLRVGIVGGDLSRPRTEVEVVGHSFLGRVRRCGLG